MPRHIFLSYVRENTECVERLAAELKAIGLEVWLDRSSIDPGQRWRDAIRAAISSGDFFLACFSRESAARAKTFMNEELTLAIDELRQRSTDRSWFIPVSLDGSPIPGRSIGGGETLRDLQWVDFSAEWDDGVARIARVAGGRLARFEKQASSLHEILRSWSTALPDGLDDLNVVRSLGAKFVLDDVLVDCTFSGFDGVDEKRLLVLPSLSSSPSLPPYVYEARYSIPQSERNRTKTYLERWTPPIIDQGNYVRLYTGSQDSLASTGRYDYWTTKAVVRSVARIQRDILDGRIEMQCLARRLDLVVVVVTSDRKVVLARRGEAVDDLSGFWMASIGESVDADLDKDDFGVPNPTRTLNRCLTEADELNLAPGDLDGAKVTYLGLATEWAFMYVNLLILVELRVNSERAVDRASQGEHSRFATVDFTPDVCLPLLRRGAFEAKPSLLGGPLVPASKVALLLSLFSRFGYDEIVARMVALG